MAAGISQAVRFAQHRQHGGQRVGLHADRVHHGNRGHVVAHGLAGARVDGVGVAGLAAAGMAPVVARRRDAAVFKRQRQGMAGRRAVCRVPAIHRRLLPDIA
ncbi:hypothetical protein G6F66_014855 [Rhizopus arrhizus]|nr:hypothetical protein G6F66_014855 [Rhizopus arrhizus]